MLLLSLQNLCGFVDKTWKWFETLATSLGRLIPYCKAVMEVKPAVSVETHWFTAKPLIARNLLKELLYGSDTP